MSGQTHGRKGELGFTSRSVGQVRQDDSGSCRPALIIRDGAVYADSKDVAEVFGKRHDNVLRDVDKLLDGGLLKIEDTPMFREVIEVNEQNHQRYRRIEMTRDGFTLLAMGFTGAKALEFKPFRKRPQAAPARPFPSRGGLHASALRIASTGRLEARYGRLTAALPGLERKWNDNPDPRRP